MDVITIPRIVQLFWQLGQEYPIAVYDIDDLMWSLMGVVCGRLGIDYQVATSLYHIRSNPKLTRQEKDAIIAAFGNPSFFQDIKFYDGVKDILRPREVGALVCINTNSFTQGVNDNKCEQLLAAVPGLRPEDIQANIITPGEARQKKHIPGMTILCEDSPYNVRDSTALVNVMTETIAWSCNEDTRHIVVQKPVVWRPNLVAINQYVYEVCVAIMAAK